MSTRFDNLGIDYTVFAPALIATWNQNQRCMSRSHCVYENEVQNRCAVGHMFTREELNQVNELDYIRADGGVGVRNLSKLLDLFSFTVFAAALKNVQPEHQENARELLLTLCLEFQVAHDTCYLDAEQVFQTEFARVLRFKLRNFQLDYYQDMSALTAALPFLN